MRWIARIVLLVSLASTCAAIEPRAAAEYFEDFAEICARDGGALWGRTLCGPFLLVDPSTRAAVASAASPSGVLEPRDGVFVGTLPATVGIANTATEWDGIRWTMLMSWSIGDAAQPRRRLMAHEAFHRIQPELGLDLYGEINAHLDTADGRFWLQLEWNALQAALLADGDAHASAVADALAFRAARRALFADAAGAEGPLELFEGLAEYTGMRLAGYTPDELVESVTRTRERDSGLVRSFAYVSGPLYGYLLDRTAADWRSAVTRETDLGQLLSSSAGVAAHGAEKADRRARRYGGRALRAAERTRARERQRRLDGWSATLVDAPVLVVDLSVVSSGAFDPNRVYPFAEHRTVYTTRELIADWGVLTVDGAILEDDATGRGYVGLAGVDEACTSGDGWTLQLNDGWHVVPGDRDGDRVVRRNE